MRRQLSFEASQRLLHIRRRITLCRKVLARLHDRYLDEMTKAQASVQTPLAPEQTSGTSLHV